jgi:hypothetical protein
LIPQKGCVSVPFKFSSAFSSLTDGYKLFISVVTVLCDLWHS